MLMVSQVLLWVAVFAIAIVLLVLARQVGILHARIAPVGALSISQGPQPGDLGPVSSGKYLNGEPCQIGGAGSSVTLMFFVSPTCPVCKQLLPTVLDVVRREKIKLIIIGDDSDQKLQEMSVKFQVPDSIMVNSMSAGRAYKVGKLPHAVLLDASGIIRSQGLVNTREHVESLIIAHEQNAPSIQEYLKASAHTTVGR